MRLILPLTLAAALASPGVAFAQAATGPAAPSLSERRLTPEQVEAILAAAAAKREAAGQEPIAGEPAPSVGRPIHGEVGFSIGTGGYRGIFGSTTVPLGEDGLAAFSFDVEDRYRRRTRD